MTPLEALQLLLPAAGISRPRLQREPFALIWDEMELMLCEHRPSKVPKGWVIVPLRKKSLEQLGALGDYLAELFGQSDTVFDVDRSSPKLPESLNPIARLVKLSLLKLEPPLVEAGCLKWPERNVILGPAPDLRHAVSFLTDFVVMYRLVESRLSADANVSTDEQRLLRQMIRVGLPDPDRNFRLFKPEGGLRTICDFTWHDSMLVVELDGYYFHRGKDVAKVVADLIAEHPPGAKGLAKIDKIAAAKDAAKRRHVGLEGYRVFTVHDTEVQSDDEALEVARQILALHKMGL